MTEIDAGSQLQQDINANILEARTELLFKNITASNTSVGFVSLMLTVVFWNDIPRLYLLIWLAFMILCISARAGINIWRRNQLKRRNDSPAWVSRYTAIITLAGLGWVAIVILGFRLDSFSQLVLSVLAFGVLATSIPLLVSFPAIFLLYAMPATITMIALTYLSGEVAQQYFALGMLSVPILSVRAVYTLNGVLIDSLRLRFQNTALVSSLSLAKEQAEALNDSLQIEIEERAEVEKLYIENLESEIQKRTTELISAKEAAEAGNRAKSEFLATMSHEIRTPMNVVMGMTELLMTGNLSSEEKKLAEAAHTSGQNLMGVINNILDFSKIEAQKQEITKEPFALKELLQKNLQVLEMEAEDKNLKLTLSFPEQFPEVVIGDKQHLAQVVTNLLGNAIKFTEKGEITLDVSEVVVSSREILVNVKVSDQGLGIPKNKLSSIFKHFTQVDSSLTRKYGGTGLGLTISQQLVRLMGGDIHVESEEGKGSVFQFTIPLELPQSKVILNSDRIAASSQSNLLSVDAAPSKQAGCRILLVEDNVQNQKLVLMMMSATGIKIDVANNGQEGLNLFLDNKYDLVLMDYHMPVMGGLEATEEIRHKEHSLGLARTAIVVLTADVQLGMREKCRDVGMDDFLSKPYGRVELLDVVEKWAM